MERVWKRVWLLAASLVLAACEPSTMGERTPSAARQALGSDCTGMPDGRGCDDGDGCTQGDTCQAGVCVAGSPVVCAALDACHSAGTCDSGTGACTHPPLPNVPGCSGEAPAFPAGYAILARETVEAGAGVTVTGPVHALGVNAPAPAIDAGADAAFNGIVTAPVVTLGAGAHVGDLFAATVTNDPTATWGAKRSYLAPVLPARTPAPARPTSGSVNVTTTTVFLPPGAYETVRVGGGHGALHLTGGLYQFGELVVEDDAGVYAAAPSLITVSGPVRVGSGGRIAASTVAAAAVNVTLVSGGGDAAGGAHAVTVGAGARIDAVVIARDTVALGASATLLGSITAQRVLLAPGAIVNWLHAPMPRDCEALACALNGTFPDPLADDPSAVTCTFTRLDAGSEAVCEAGEVAASMPPPVFADEEEMPALGAPDPYMAGPAPSPLHPPSWVNLNVEFPRAPGECDDTRRLQRAIDSLVSKEEAVCEYGTANGTPFCTPLADRPGGPAHETRSTLLVPAGDYTISSTLEVRALGVRIVGEGSERTRIRWSTERWTVTEDPLNAGQYLCTEIVAPQGWPQSWNQSSCDAGAPGCVVSRQLDYAGEWMIRFNGGGYSEMKRLTLDGISDRQAFLAAEGKAQPTRKPEAAIRVATHNARPPWTDAFNRQRTRAGHTSTRFTDLVIRRVHRGIWAGIPGGANDDHGIIRRVRFEDIGEMDPVAWESPAAFRVHHEAALRLDSWNAYNWQVWDSTFEDVVTGIATTGGGFVAFGNRFQRSRFADMVLAGGTDFLTIRGNTSIDSARFIATAGLCYPGHDILGDDPACPGTAGTPPPSGSGWLGHVGGWTVEPSSGSDLIKVQIADNLVRRDCAKDSAGCPAEEIAVDVRGFAADITLTDNAFRRTTTSRLPFVRFYAVDTQPGLSRIVRGRGFFAGNKYFAPEPFSRVLRHIDPSGAGQGTDRVIDADQIGTANNAAEDDPAFTPAPVPPTPKTFTGPVLHVPAPTAAPNATLSPTSAADLQPHLQWAASHAGERPILHLPAGYYLIESEIALAAGSDARIVGDGFGTRLRWLPGPNAGNYPLFHLHAPARATVADMLLEGQSAQVAASAATPGGMGVIIESADDAAGQVYLRDTFVNARTDNAACCGYDGTSCDQTKPDAGADGGVSVCAQNDDVCQAKQAVHELCKDKEVDDACKTWTRSYVFGEQGAGYDHLGIRADGAIVGGSWDGLTVYGAGASQKPVRFYGVGSHGVIHSLYHLEGGARVVAQAVEQENGYGGILSGDGALTFAGTRLYLAKDAHLCNTSIWNVERGQNVELVANEFAGDLTLLGVPMNVTLHRRVDPNSPAHAADRTLLLGVDHMSSSAVFLNVDVDGNPIDCSAKFSFSGSGPGQDISQAILNNWWIFPTGALWDHKWACADVAASVPPPPPGKTPEVAYIESMLADLRQAKVERPWLHAANGTATDVRVERVHYDSLSSHAGVWVRRP